MHFYFLSPIYHILSFSMEMTEVTVTVTIFIIALLVFYVLFYRLSKRKKNKNVLPESSSSQTPIFYVLALFSLSNLFSFSAFSIQKHV